MPNLQLMDIMLEIISLLLLINGILLRKKVWGQRLMYFAMGMIFVFILRRIIPWIFMM